MHKRERVLLQARDMRLMANLGGGGGSNRWAAAPRLPTVRLQSLAQTANHMIEDEAG